MGAVLKAVAEELGRVGYAALRVEDVAVRSKVNKTTIYRRYPTKVELVTAAIRAFADVPETPDTGSVATDLLALLQHSAKRAATAVGRGLVRAIQLEQAHPEVELVKQKIAVEQLAPRRAVVERAIERGELPANTDADLVIELIFSPVMRRIVMQHRAADDAFLESAVSVVVAGARSGAAVRRGKSAVSTRK